MQMKLGFSQFVYLQGGGCFFKEFLYFRKMEKQTIISKSHVSLDILFPKSFVFKNRFCVMFGNSLTIWFCILKQLICQCYWVIKIKTTAKSCKKNHIKGFDLFIQFNFFWTGYVIVCVCVLLLFRSFFNVKIFKSVFVFPNVFCLPPTLIQFSLLSSVEQSLKKQTHNIHFLSHLLSQNNHLFS